MHIIIDIRTDDRNQCALIRYAESWAHYWIQTHPKDTCSFLVLKWQVAPKKFPYIIGAKKPSLIQKARSFLQKYENTRCVSFSKFEPYYQRLQTISHIFNMGDCLYASKRKKEQYEQTLKKKISWSKSVIVPNFFTGNELTELMPEAEDSLEIIPYFPVQYIPPETALFGRVNIKTPYFLYDGSYENENNIEALIRWFAAYVHTYHSDYYLVLHGYSSPQIRILSDVIQSSKIGHRIIVTGLLDIREQEALYKNASGWIDVSHYITSDTKLALALSHRIPLLLSDIKAFEYYTNAVKIHPNNLIRLPEYFIQLAGVPNPASVPSFFSDITHTMKTYHTLLTKK